MDYRNYEEMDHPWDDGVYGTGPTEPPKSRGGLVALLLILVIFLCGIVTVLGILNVRLFAQLKTMSEPKLAIAVVDEPQVAMETEPPAAPQEELPAPMEKSAKINLQESPMSIDNITFR